MQIAEILDRLELLYPDNSIFSDLRKTLLSQDKFALFRIKTMTVLMQTVLVEDNYKVNYG
jgi:hypothetical protein